VSTEVRATGEVHPVNRNESKNPVLAAVIISPVISQLIMIIAGVVRSMVIVTFPGDISLIFVQSVTIDQGVV